MVRLAFILFLFGLVVGVACDDDPSADESATLPCTNDATVEAIQDANAEDTSSDPRTTFRVADNEIQCRLRRALVTLDDLPQGWEVSSFGSGLSGHVYTDDLPAGCRLTYPGYRDALTATFDRSIENPSGTSLLMATVIALHEGDGPRVMAALRHSCAQAGEVDTTWQLVDSPTYADESLAVDQTSFDETPVTVRTHFIRQDDVIAQLSIVPPDVLDAAPLVEGVGSRLAAVGPLPEPEVVEGTGCLPEDRMDEPSERLRSLLVTLEDAPAGWIENPPGQCGFIDVSSNCAAWPEAAASATTGFVGWRSSVGHTVKEFEGDGARILVEDVRRTLEAGGSECDVRFGDVTFQWEFSSIAHSFGDDVLSWRADSRGLPDGEITMVVVLMRREEYASLVRFTSVGLSFQDFRLDDEFYVERISPFVESARQRLDDLAK